MDVRLRTRSCVFPTSNAGIAINNHDHIKERHTFETRDKSSGVARTEYTRLYLEVGAVQAFSEPNIDATQECVHKVTSSRVANGVANSEMIIDNDERTEESK